MPNFQSKTRPYIEQSAFFFLINALYFVSFHALWDGRLWYQLMKNQDLTSIFWITDQAKIPLHFHLYAFLATTPYPLFYSKVISFISLLFTGLIARWYIERHEIGDSVARFWAGILLCLMPSYLVGVEFAHAQYNFGIFTFFAVMWFHSVVSDELKNEKWQQFFLNSFTVLICYWAFSVNRALMFIFPVFLVSSVLQNRERSVDKRWASVITEWAKAHWMFLLLPLISWVLRDKPYGIYATYNQVNLSNVSGIYEKLKSGIKGGALGNPLRIIKLGFYDSGLIAFSLLMSVLYFFFSRKYVKKTLNKLSTNFILLAGSYLLLLMIVFPYAVVGKSAGFIDYESRHAILFVYPQCIMLCLFVTLVRQFFDKKKISMLPIHLLVALLLGFTSGGVVHVLRWWDVDWLKREAMTERFKESEKVRKASFVEVYDKTEKYDALHRGVEFYDLSPLAEEAFQNKTHLVYDMRWTLSHIVQDPMVRKNYGLGDVNMNGDKIKVYFDYGSLDLFDWNTYFKLKHAQIFNYEKFLSQVKEAVTMKEGEP